MSLNILLDFSAYPLGSNPNPEAWMLEGLSREGIAMPLQRQGLTEVLGSLIGAQRMQPQSTLRRLVRQLTVTAIQLLIMFGLVFLG